jgi:hypothetical protein
MRILALAALTGALAYPQSLATLPIKKGVTVATCFSGWKTIGTAPPYNNSWSIDLDGPVVGLIDTHDKAPSTGYGLATNWKPAMFHNETAANAANKWTARRMGQVFGIAIDKEGNIFVAASRVYGAQGAVGETGAGLWGSAGPGGIYRIDAQTGDVSDFIVTNNSPVYSSASPNTHRLPNTGPGLGNLAYDGSHDQLLVTNFEDGRIYRVSGLSGTAGNILGFYDPFDPDNGVAGFSDAMLSITAGTEAGERIWGIGVFGGRAYFSTWAEDAGRSTRNLTNAVYSVAITAAGVLNGSTIRKEFDAVNFPGSNFSNPVSDIEFGSNGRMLIAERSQLIANQPYSGRDLVHPPERADLTSHRSRVFEIPLSGSTNSTYNPALYVPHYVGISTTDSAGGVDFGYLDYDDTNKILEGCEKMIWSSGDYLRAPGPQAVYGIHGAPAGHNTPGWNDDYMIDLNGVLGTQDKTLIGDVDVFRDPCGPEGNTGITSSYLDCVNEGTGQYNFVLTVSNNNNSDAHGAVVLLPNGAVTNVTFNPPLPPGGSTTVTIPITIGPRNAGDIVNFVFQFHGKPLAPPFDYEWCEAPITLPVRVPECGCLTATLIRSGPTANSFALLIKNHAVDPAATFVTIDAKTTGVNVTPSSLNLSIPYGNSVLVPIAFTPTPAAGTFVRLAITLHGKNLGNGLFENCCMEEGDFLIPRLGIATNSTGIYGRVFEDLNRNLKPELREPAAAGVAVTFRSTNREREPITVRTNESGEYFIPIPAAGLTGSYQLELEAPRGLNLLRVYPIRTFLPVAREPIAVANFSLVRPAAETLPGNPIPNPTLTLEPVDGIGGGATSAIRYSVPAGMATLRLLDANGAEAGVVHDGFHAGGDYVAVVRSHDWQTGLYTLELNASGDTKQQHVFVAPMEEATPPSAANQAGVKLFRVQVSPARR